MFLNPQADPVVLPTIVGCLVLIPEVFIILTRFTRSRSTVPGDSYSLLSILSTIFVSICLAVPFVFFHLHASLYYFLGTAGVLATFLILIVGITIRWWSIHTLGVFFTVNVAAHDDHRLITAGPYKWIRHPSYTGLLLEVLALAITFQNVVSLLIIMIPTTLALIYRIAIEERVLARTLGEDYRLYHQKTYSLVPFVF
jgi:protein-S-isoprenylcysteine O-methyltransferase